MRNPPTRCFNLYLKTPRLKGLLGLNLAVASASAMVIVNTVILVRELLKGDDQDVAILYAAYGCGSILVALVLPRLLAYIAPRSVMLIGGFSLALGLAGAIPVAPNYLTFLGIWAILGAGASFIQTPAGMLLKRSAQIHERPGLFTAQFTLSHACWLVAYLAAGWLGASVRLEFTFAALAGVAALGTVIAAIIWPRHDPLVLDHEHQEMVHVHEMVDDAHHAGEAVEWIDDKGTHRHPSFRHSHVYVIDDHHSEWPRFHH